MPSQKSIRKSRRVEAVARAKFKRFSQASWALYLAEGDEISAPAPEAERKLLETRFWDAAAAEHAATERVNLRNVGARFARGSIRKDQIPATCESVRRSMRERQ